MAESRATDVPIPMSVRTGERTPRRRRRRRVAILATALASIAVGASCGGGSGAKVLGVVYDRNSPDAAQAPGSIVGAVTSGGQPVPEAEVLLTGTGARGRVSTGADGTYRFDDVRPGGYWIQVSDTGGSGASCPNPALCISDRPGEGESRPVTVEPGVATDASFAF